MNGGGQTLGVEDYLQEILELVKTGRPVHQSAPSPMEAHMLIESLRKKVKSLGSAVTSMEEYERNGGGASIESWWDGYVGRHRQAREYYSRAFEAVEVAASIPLTT